MAPLKHQKPASTLTEAALTDELAVLGREWDEFRAGLDEDGGMAGSPGEWMVERMDELETELRKRRARKKVQP